MIPSRATRDGGPFGKGGDRQSPTAPTVARAKPSSEATAPVCRLPLPTCNCPSGQRLCSLETGCGYFVRTGALSMPFSPKLSGPRPGAPLHADGAQRAPHCGIAGRSLPFFDAGRPATTGDKPFCRDGTGTPRPARPVLPQTGRENPVGVGAGGYWRDCGRLPVV